MNGCVVAMELLRHNTKGSKLMAVLAGILAFSRVFAGMHYPSDVLGRAAMRPSSTKLSICRLFPL